MKDDLQKRIWWSYIDHDLQELLLQSINLVEKVENWEVKFHDYAFVVFPASKAFEGYLKKLFLDLDFITKKQYYGKRFRVGKALNPQLETKYRERYSVYDKLVGFCGGPKLADQLWLTWKTGRNLLFHWFPKEKNAIEYQEAVQKVNMILDSMDLAFKRCKVPKRFDSSSPLR